MRHALLLTAHDRVGLLRQVLTSWAAVPELAAWHLRVAVEPGPAAAEMQAAVMSFVEEAGLTDVRLVVNGRRLGVAENPFRHLGALVDEGFDFVARTEDDLLAADDVLRLLEHAATAYRDDAGVAVVCGFSRAAAGADPAVLARTPDFIPWLWGTWRDRWTGLIGPTWDHDYSTWNRSPGFEAGWDWHLNTRVLPAHGLTTIAPLASRVQNIGVEGQHGTPDTHETAASFRSRFGHITYREAATE